MHIQNHLADSKFLVPKVYNLFHPEPTLIADLYEGVRCRIEGSGVVALGYDASSRNSRSGGPWIYANPVLILHRRGFREIAYHDGTSPVVRCVGDGKVSLLPAGCAVRVDYKEPCEGLVIGLAHRLVATRARSLEKTNAFPFRLGLSDDALVSMAETFWHSRAASRQFADALADALLLHILEHHTHVPQTAAPVPAWLKAAIEHVLDHLCEPISLDEIADASGLSRAHFARSFKRQTGLSPLDFVMKARAERARELILAQPDASLASVAAASGFCDQSHLTNHFRRHFGTTPAAFRRHPHADPTEQHFRPRSRRDSLLSFT